MLRYIKLHRNQQKEERAFALGQIQEARDLVADEQTRQPKKAHLLIDAWTSSNGDSPKVMLFFFTIFIIFDLTRKLGLGLFPADFFVALIHPQPRF